MNVTMKTLSLILPNYRLYTIRFIASLCLLISCAFLLTNFVFWLVAASLLGSWLYVAVQVLTQVIVIALLATRTVVIYTGKPGGD
jgi:hypothetical protein